MAPSKCDQLLAKGKAEYNRLSKGSCVFAAPVRGMKLTRAFQYYIEALGCSHTATERAECLKYLGLLHVMWCEFEFEDAMKKGAVTGSNKLAVFKPKLLTAVKYLLEALREGKSADRPEAWLEHLHAVLLDLVGWVVKQKNRVLGLSSAPLLRWLCEGFDLGLAKDPKNPVGWEVAGIAHLRLAEAVFQQGILKGGDDEDEVGDFRGRHASMHDCLQSLRKASSLFANCHGQDTANGALLEIEKLENRANDEICVCDSMQLLRTGDQVLEKALVDDKVNKELGMQGVDVYKSAASLAHGRYIEAEAIAMSRLGKVYSDVLKDPVKASKYHYKAIKLAHTLTSPQITSSRWYKYSCDKFAEHKEQEVTDEERNDGQERAPPKKRMEEELRKLDREAKKGEREFLLYIYQNHPHPDPKKVPGDTLKEKGHTKQMLRAAVRYFHPDVNHDQGEEWRVKCEEICKILNNMRSIN